MKTPGSAFIFVGLVLVRCTSALPTPTYVVPQVVREALEQETKSVAGGGDVKTSFVVSGEEQVLPPGVEAVLLRICQEALTNVHKYAKATQLTVTLAFDDS